LYNIPGNCYDFNDYTLIYTKAENVARNLSFTSAEKSPSGDLGVMAAKVFLFQTEKPLTPEGEPSTTRIPVKIIGISIRIII
jgi:hypothetical protein